MACSRFEYVKQFEQHSTLLPDCWAVLRLDGRSFTRFCSDHCYRKPNDEAGLQLMNAAASAVLADHPDFVLAFGQSDEFSFLLRPYSNLFSRRTDKILSVCATLFAAEFVRQWHAFFPATPLRRTPAFDARIVLYPTTRHIRDYLAWRQADVHVNNLFNTTFWALVHRGGHSQADAEKILSGTTSAQKNELLFATFNMNYNNEKPIFRKGSVLIRAEDDVETGCDHSVVAHTNGPQHYSMDLADSGQSSQSKGINRLPEDSQIHYIDLENPSYLTAAPSVVPPRAPQQDDQPRPPNQPLANPDHGPYTQNTPNTTHETNGNQVQVNAQDGSADKQALREKVDHVRAAQGFAELNTQVSDHRVMENAPRQRRKNMNKSCIRVLHTDIIRDDFWLQRPSLLEESNQMRRGTQRRSNHQK